MIRVGAVNIDTSHPMAFAEVMAKGDRARYAAVYNDSFRDDGEVNGFMQRFGLERRCASLEELAGCCDVAFIHGCDWDTRVRQCRVFAKKKTPVFMDKPIAGNIRDCRALEELADSGAVLLGASAARYAYEAVEFINTPETERGKILTVYGTSGVDEFNYGIHIIEAIGALAGRGASSVRWVGAGSAGNIRSETYSVSFDNGVNALYSTCIGVWQPFVITVVTTKNVWQLKLDTGRLYDALLERVFNSFEGKGNRTAPISDLTESVRVMLAGRLSRENGGRPVSPDEIPDGDPGFDGHAFWTGYGAAAKPMYAM